MPAHQYNLLQMTILASLPQVDEEGQGDYQTAQGLKLAQDAHPLVAQASLRSLRAHLGILVKTGACIRLRSYHGRTKVSTACYAVQPVKRA